MAEKRAFQLSPSLWNIGILLHKQATRIKHFCPECIIRTVSSQILLCSGTVISFQAGLAEIKCTMYFVLPKQPIKQFKLV